MCVCVCVRVRVRVSLGGDSAVSAVVQRLLCLSHWRAVRVSCIVPVLVKTESDQLNMSHYYLVWWFLQATY